MPTCKVVQGRHQHDEVGEDLRVAEELLDRRPVGGVLLPLHAEDEVDVATLEVVHDDIVVRQCGEVVEALALVLLAPLVEEGGPRPLLHAVDPGAQLEHLRLRPHLAPHVGHGPSGRLKLPECLPERHERPLAPLLKRYAGVVRQKVKVQCVDILIPAAA